MMRPTLLTISWLLSDLAVFIGAYVLAYFFRVGWILSTDFPFAPFLAAVGMSAVGWLFVMLITGTYRLTRSQKSVRNIAILCYSTIVGASLFTLSYYFLYGLFFSRLLLVESLILSMIAIVGWHVLFEQILRRALRRAPPTFPTLIVGATREAHRLIQRLQEHRHPLVPVGILDVTGTKEKELEGVPVLGRLHLLEPTLKQFGITHLIQASNVEQSINLLSACRAHKITYLLLPSVLGIVERDERVESLEGHAVTMVSPHSGWKTWLFG